MYHWSFTWKEISFSARVTGCQYSRNAGQRSPSRNSARRGAKVFCGGKSLRWERFLMGRFSVGKVFGLGHREKLPDGRVPVQRASIFSSTGIPFVFPFTKFEVWTDQGHPGGIPRAGRRKKSCGTWWRARTLSEKSWACEPSVPERCRPAE